MSVAIRIRRHPPSSLSSNRPTTGSAASTSRTKCLLFSERCIFITSSAGIAFCLIAYSVLHSLAVYDVGILDPSGSMVDLPLTILNSAATTITAMVDRYDIMTARAHIISEIGLEFVHITKTAGSAIEEAAARSGVKWGVCHWKRVNKFGPICMYKDWEVSRPAYNRSAIPFQFKGSLGEPWHTPPHWFRENPYVGSKTFCVVRDPYERIISEYYSKFGGYNGPDRNNVTIMNGWVQKRLSPGVKKQVHRLPQHLYVYNLEGEKVVNHVLRFEQLDSDFTALMERYGLGVALPQRLNARNATTSMLTTANLTDDTIQMINDFYDADFRLFNYSKVKDSIEMLLMTSHRQDYM